MSAPHTALAFSVPAQYVFHIHTIPWSSFDTAVNVLHIVDAPGMHVGSLCRPGLPRNQAHVVGSPGIQQGKKSAVKLGTDVLSIDGFECAGHPGEQDIGSLVLLARAVQDLKVPYLVSDGIADARGVAAALALDNCQDVHMGTRFVCIVESPIHENIKKTIVKSSEQDTVHIFRTLHNTARVFKTKVSLKVVSIGRRPGISRISVTWTLKFGLLVYVVSFLVSLLVFSMYCPWFINQIAVGLINDIPMCEDLLRTIEKGV
ncbi:hypothetical protein B0H14DRAFT_3501366 [Mycena olivaceomarginata]|nr:hypothetical protein B0H14DRAFT_3501366 [Mycena olivaceomarginata]